MDGSDGRGKEVTWVCACVAYGKQKRRRTRTRTGWANLPNQKKEEEAPRERLENGEKRESDTGQSEQGNEERIEGEKRRKRRETGWVTRATRRCSSSIFDDFSPIFMSSCITQLPEINSITFPLSISPQIWRDLALKLDETARKGAAALASNCSILKQFLSIATTHSFLLRPRTKPKH